MTARVVALRWLQRVSLLVLWALVLWGGLLLLLTVLDAAGEGLRPALARLLPPPGASAWAWLNALSAALALAVVIVIGGLLVSSHRARARPPLDL
jgi:hypothetical protein